MTQGHKKAFFIGITLLFFVLLAGFIGASHFINSAKPRLEQTISNALNMQVASSSMNFLLMPPGIAANKITVTDKGSEAIRIAELEMRLDPLALVRGRIRVPAISLVEPEINMTLLNKSNFKISVPVKDSDKTDTGPMLPETVKISDGRLIFHTDENFLEISGAGLDLRDIVPGNHQNEPILAGLSLSGEVRIRQLRWYGMIFSGIKAPLRVDKGSFLLAPVSFTAFKGNGQARIEAEVGDGNFRTGLQFDLAQFRIEDFFTSLSRQEMVRGSMNLTVSLAVQGKNRQELLRSMDGTAVMSGQNISITRFNLDSLLEEYMQTQRFNLVDLGAYAIMGPLGPALTKTYDFSGLLQAGHEGTTEVRRLVSNWEIDDGMAKARDVAMATGKNRVAVKGQIDLANRSFQDLTVAVVDANGCVIVKQVMNGSYNEPVVEQPNFLETAAAPLVNILKGTAEIITRSNCEIFYSGSVSHPDS